MSAVGAESLSGADVIASISSSDLSRNGVLRARAGFEKFTDRERSVILDGFDRKFPRSGKCVLAERKYRQTQPRDLTEFSVGAAAAGSKTVKMTVKWFGFGQTRRPRKFVSSNISAVSQIASRIDHRVHIVNGRQVKLLFFIRCSTLTYATLRYSPTPTRSSPAAWTSHRRPRG